MYALVASRFSVIALMNSWYNCSVSFLDFTHCFLAVRISAVARFSCLRRISKDGGAGTEGGELPRPDVPIGITTSGTSFVAVIFSNESVSAASAVMLTTRNWDLRFAFEFFFPWSADPAAVRLAFLLPTHSNSASCKWCLSLSRGILYLPGIHLATAFGEIGNCWLATRILSDNHPVCRHRVSLRRPMIVCINSFCVKIYDSQCYPSSPSKLWHIADRSASVPADAAVLQTLCPSFSVANYRLWSCPSCDPISVVCG